MEEFVPIDADLQSPSSLSGGASLGAGGPSGVGPGGLTSTMKGEDKAMDRVGDRAGDGTRVMFKLSGNNGWIASTGRSASTTTP